MTRIRIITEPHQDLLESITYDVTEWCINYFNLQKKVKKITVDISGIALDDAWGECGEDDKDGHYLIDVSPLQSTRDFVATLVHEIVHVKQWATGKWVGEGEREANQLQYALTDKVWKEGVF